MAFRRHPGKQLTLQRFKGFICHKKKHIMKSLFYLPVFLLAIVIIFSECRKSTDSPQVKTESESNVLANTIIYRFGFENSDHDTSFKGWISPGYSFSKDVPQYGGAWSLRLIPGWIPQQGYADHYITLDTGRYHLKFSSYTKVQGNGIGIGYLRLFKQQKNSVRKTLVEKSFTNNHWKINAVFTSVTIQPGDVIVIELSAGTSELAAWQTLFDNVRLEKQ